MGEAGILMGWARGGRALNDLGWGWLKGPPRVRHAAQSVIVAAQYFMLPTSVLEELLKQ